MWLVSVVVLPLLPFTWYVVVITVVSVCSVVVRLEKFCCSMSNLRDRWLSLSSLAKCGQ